MKQFALAIVGLVFSIGAHAQLLMFLVAVPEADAEVVAREDRRLYEALYQGPSLAMGESFLGLQFLIEGRDGVELWNPTTAADQAMLGGRPVKRRGHSLPTLVLEPAKVRLAARALTEVNEQELVKRYQPMTMDQSAVDPLGWQERGDEGLAYLLSFLGPLRSFYGSAAVKDQSVLVFFSVGHVPAGKSTIGASSQRDL
jgi:hypothetical protein